MKSYCVFGKTQRCEEIAKRLEQKLPCRAIYPRRIQHTWSKGKMVDLEHILLPGYVFVYVQDETELDTGYLRHFDGVLKVLSYDDDSCELKGQDAEFARMILENDGVLGKLPVYEEGQWLQIKEGPLKGVESQILKVNRRNHRMLIEIPFADTKVKTWVEYERTARVTGDQNG